MLLALSTAALAGDLLFVGASYMHANNLSSTFETLLDGDHSVTDLSVGGTTWAEHVALVSTEPTWAEAIVDTPFSVVFLHEIADVADQPQDSATWLESLSAGSQLVAWVGANGASVVVWQTWGDRDGGPDFADYAAMQDALSENTVAYLAAFDALGVPTYAAPIGDAWRLAFAADADPLDPSALFFRLYEEDGQHPSFLGSYLVACVLYGTLTGTSPEGLPPADLVTPADATAVQTLAWEAVVESVAAGASYPWTDSGGGDTGDSGDSDGGDSGDPDSGVPDSGGPDSSNSSGDSSPTDTSNGTVGEDSAVETLPSCPAGYVEGKEDGCAEAKSCGCAGGPSQGGSLAVGLSLLMGTGLLGRRPPREA